MLETRSTELRNRGVPFGMFQCTTKYPTPLADVGLNILLELRDRLSCPVGLSDHSGSPFPSLAAMAQGAAMIEVHIAFHRRQFGPDMVASVPQEFALLARARDAFHTLLSHPVDKNAVAQSIADMRRLFGKSVALKQAQPKGTLLTREMLTTKKPGTGLPPDAIESLVGRRLRATCPQTSFSLLEISLSPGSKVSARAPQSVCRRHGRDGHTDVVSNLLPEGALPDRACGLRMHARCSGCPFNFLFDLSHDALARATVGIAEPIIERRTRSLGKLGRDDMRII